MPKIFSYKRIANRRALQNVVDAVEGESGFDPALLKTVTVAGGEKEAELTATGLATDDTLVSVIAYGWDEENGLAVTSVDLSDVSIPKADVLVVDADTTGLTLVVTAYAAA